MSIKKVVTRDNLGTGFSFDEQGKKINVNFPPAPDGGLQSVSVSGVLEGNGTSNNPIKVKVKENSGITVTSEGLSLDADKIASLSKDGGFKPIATVELRDAFDEHIGWALSSDERVSQ